MAGQHVFLCYHHENKAEAARLRADLLAAGYQVWWDQLLEPNQDRYFEMRNAMDDSRVLLVCLSREAVAKTTAGIYMAARDAIEFSPVYERGEVVVIPVRFSDCVVPAFSIDATRTLDQLACIDLFPEAQRGQGLTGLQEQLDQAIATAPPGQPSPPPAPRIEQRLGSARPVETQQELTQILQLAYQGDAAARNRLWAVVYKDLQEIARRQLRGERRSRAPSTFTLVHEAFLKLSDHDRMTWRNREHFYALSCEIMKRILIDRARRRDAIKREGDKNLVPLDEAAQKARERPDRLLDLYLALEKLAEWDMRLSKIVDCKFFGGLTTAETAEALGMAKRTVERDWQRARTYLYKLLSPKRDNPNRSDS